MRIELTIPAIPVAQPRQRVAMIAGNVRTYTPTRHPVNAFKAAVGQAWYTAGGGKLDGPLGLGVLFVLPRPKRLTRKRGGNPRVVHDRLPDLDNLTKALMDGLTVCGAWHNDCQVCQCHAVKAYASGDESPHVELIVEQF